MVDEKKRAEENNCNINFSCEVFEGCFRIYFMLRDKIYDKTYVNDLYVSFHCTNLGDVRRNVVNIIEELYKEMEKNRMKMYYNSVYGTTGFLSQYPPIVKNIDVIPAKEIWKMGSWINTNIKIKNVIFNDPATIVFWSDGSKTVVKCQDDDWFDPEKGLTMAISKKALGNKGNYCNELKKWLPKEKSEVQEFNYIGNVESITKLNVHSIGRNLIPAYSEEGFIDGMKHTVGITKEATTIAEAVNTKNEEDAKKRESVQKAYEILTQLKNNKGLITKECYEDAVEGILDHLDEALED